MVSSSVFDALLPLASVAWLLGVATAALGSLVVVAFVAVYLLRNNPQAFLKLRKLRPQPEKPDSKSEE
jgi:hypothetical protein